jgi:hypothetical protein
MLAVVLALPALFRENLLGAEDNTFYFEQRSFLAHQIHLGEIPYWNPCIFSGYPEIGDPGLHVTLQLKVLKVERHLHFLHLLGGLERLEGVHSRRQGYSTPRSSPK